MKVLILSCLILIAGCSSRDESLEDVAQAEMNLRTLILNLHNSLQYAYQSRELNTDSLIGAYYANDLYYVTPWGDSEPIDSTKARLKRAVQRLSNYDHTIENLHVSVFGKGAYAFFILRQTYEIDGFPLSEYLPTTYVFEKQGNSWKIIHAQRSTDYETFRQYVALQKHQQEK